MSILSASQFQTSQSHNYTHEICLFKYYRIYLHFIESTDLNIVKKATIDRTSRCSISFKRWSDGFFLICASDFLESLTLHLLLQPFPMWVRTQLLEQRIKGCVLASNFEEKKKKIYIYGEREREGEIKLLYIITVNLLGTTEKGRCLKGVEEWPGHDLWCLAIDVSEVASPQTSVLLRLVRVQ